MSYEIITPDGKNLHLRVHVDTKDTLENRKIAHQIRQLVEKLRNPNNDPNRELSEPSTNDKIGKEFNKDYEK